MYNIKITNHTERSVIYMELYKEVKRLTNLSSLFLNNFSKINQSEISLLPLRFYYYYKFLIFF